ncbi:hypothetical protein PRZ48_005028 [Zasmidium cellare]|uniref:Uncharacterized protein n=1 Tax=Zasmidium cellare TaxID=395010 RepID=A0ABR0ETE4_ZASCE|nr:hypothetical protein PRZ48_005028 [Zasmidium cellare]
MARVSEVVSSSRDTSPDPITLPSSPIVARSDRKPRTSLKPSPRKMNRRSATPSKSVILDTPRGGNDSPWRIKVTVEAEPRDGSPGKRMTRTTSVPLKDSASKRSSSPSKRVAAQNANGGVKRPGRKRKGTPLRDTRPARQYNEPEPATQEDDVVPQRSHSPARRASGRLARLSAQPGSARSKRLSYARDELDQALQNAVGYSDMDTRCDAPGEMTTSKNEDFSMVSVESLQTAKEVSMSNVMQTIPEGDKSAATVSYMDSSPPKVRYPNIERKADKARSSLGKSVSNTHDPMSWKPTPASTSSLHSSAKQQQERRLHNERQWQEERESVSQQISHANDEDVVLVDDGQDDVEDDEQEVEHENEQEVVAEDDDIWQDEASRSIEEHQGNQSRHGAVEEQRRSPQMEDLFAGQPLKPLRAKIPRTWRRSSGMDFSYVDSPAHQPVEEDQPDHDEDEAEEMDEASDEGSEAEPEEEAEEETAGHAEVQTQDRRHSTDGSGVLTPPSTEDSEEAEEDVEEDVEEESDFEPDAEATRMQDVDEEENEEEAASPGSDDSMSSPDGEDTGNFFQANLPQVYLKEKPRRRPPRQKTMDLTEMLNLDGSPAKAAITGSRAGAAGSPKIHEPAAQTKRSPVQKRVIAPSLKPTTDGQGRDKLLGSPLRKSLLRSSKMYGSPAGATRRRDRETFFPVAMQRPHHAHTRPAHVDDTDNGYSFESKASDQRQLLSEAAIQEQQHQEYVHDEYEEDEDEEMAYDDQPQDSHQPYVEEEEYYEEEEVQDMKPEEEEYYEEDDYYEEETVDPSQSYEERLNLDSPQKVQVNFNDSKTASSLFVNKNNPRLFNPSTVSRYPPAQSFSHLDSPGTITLVGKKPAQQPQQPGFFSRLSTTFWNAVTRPPVYAEEAPAPAPAPAPTRTAQAQARTQTHQAHAQAQPQTPIQTRQPQPLTRSPTPEYLTLTFPADLRTQIRNRYGVLSSHHPWTFAHMRTLQRMVNSATSHRPDTIIPRAGRLPYYLESIIDTTQTDILGREFFFEYEHTYIVHSFFQILVSPDLIDAMRRGEVERLGDEWSKSLQENFSGVAGDGVVFKEEIHGKVVADWVNWHKGRIGMEFVVKALGTIVLHNQDLERRWGMSIEELQAKQLIGKEPPER